MKFERHHLPNNTHAWFFGPLRPVGLEKQPRLPKFHALAFKNRPGPLLDRYYQFSSLSEPSARRIDPLRGLRPPMPAASAPPL
ncbi:hypothetical protein, partial [Acidithiobacillus ferriphilus]|uniref:hypothetical protein n=1 Tax=Acidithiobacillus ferriphilus TaxID=1689834 RepID=UPI002DB7B11E